MRKSHRITTLAVAVATALATVGGAASAAVPTDTSGLRNAVSAEGALKHAQVFQDIADANGDTRASGTPGYDASADYVADALADAGYLVRRQTFAYELFIETADPVLDITSPDQPAYTPGEDFLTMEYSGAGDVTAAVTAVDITIPPAATPSSTSGCEAADFAGFPAGNIALIQRGTCTFREKVDNAAAAGAVGVIIFNEGQPGRTDVLSGTLGPPQAAIPAVGTSFAVGQEFYTLLQSGPVTARLAVSAEVQLKDTENIIADTTSGRTDRTVVAGAHLDSVLEGPGINDNGSGSATVLEIALQMAALDVQPTNRVRFTFWGAEESGLIGSQFYVDSLTQRERKDIALYLNFDMVGSPNYVRFVYDGDGSAFGIKGPTGSARIEQVFTQHFASEGLASAPTAFDGRSDYDAFISVGIPAGGLFTGAEGIKTPAQAAVYGGVAGAAYDPCYHQACDSMTPVADGADAALYAQLAAAYDLEGNLNMEALEEMADAAAHATLTFAMTTSAVSGTARSSSESTSLFKGTHLQR
ncbi:M20/M25/M40 family metallo-hydrolase [Kribbella catacumbae]|uniref:M20/M25/M40 family metallo-hydrolase n=1 Tax=Kribbella catacumbae TaxID=460086 RepID=UPI00037622BD|nr:M20/M25/M40 family metallo-hydrolase [Kribbella catacumbae]